MFQSTTKLPTQLCTCTHLNSSTICDHICINQPYAIQVNSQYDRAKSYPKESSRKISTKIVSGVLILNKIRYKVCVYMYVQL